MEACSWKLEPAGIEGVEVGAVFRAQDQGAYGCGDERSKEDAVAELAAGNKEPGNAALSQHGRAVGRARAQAGPHLGDAPLRQRRNYSRGFADETPAGLARHRCVETGVFDGGADEDTIVARRKIDFVVPDQTARQRGS